MRTVTCGLILAPSAPYWLARSYQLMNDGTIWFLATQFGVDWRPLGPPAGVSLNYLYAVANPTLYPDYPDTLFVSATDGSIWSAAYPYGSPTGQPLAWTPVTTIPQPTG